MVLKIVKFMIDESCDIVWKLRIALSLSLFIIDYYRYLYHKFQDGASYLIANFVFGITACVSTCVLRV